MRDGQERVQAQAGVVVVGGADVVAVVNLRELVGGAVGDVRDDAATRPAGDAREEVAGVVLVAHHVAVRVGERRDAVEGVVGEGGAIADQGG